MSSIDNKTLNIFESFSRDGYTLIEDLFDEQSINELKQECAKIVEQNSDHGSIFSAGVNQHCDEYFLQSSDKISLFYEKDAFDEVRPGTTANPESMQRSLNKIGHALHWHNSTFKQFTFGSKIQQLSKAIGLKDPVVVQSMIIFKNPSIGTEVPAHQDASFLYTEPNPAVFGFWIPLEDATELNGCLEFIPKSHRTVPLQTRWIRKSDETDGPVRMVHTNPDHNYHDSGKFIPVPARKGSCILIDGLVVHRSNANRSPFPRPVYTFHVFDRAAGNGDSNRWDPLNWLQPTPSLAFPPLYCNSI